MDQRGAVDLQLPATTVQRPVVVDDVAEELANLASQHGWGWIWRRQQMTYLFGASIILCHLRTVASHPLAILGVQRDPADLTLGQLALARHGTSHNGTAGQSFEFAVADAVNSGVSSVTVPIADRLRELGVDADSRALRAIVTGIEGLAQNATDRLLEAVRDCIPAKAAIRTGRRGRPMQRDTALEQLASHVGQWNTMVRSDMEPQLPDYGQLRNGGHVVKRTQEAAERGAVSQLGRADVWIYTEDYIVPTQLKINPDDVPLYGWRDVPLWIVAGLLPSRLKDRRLLLNRLPRVVVELEGEFDRDRFVAVVQAVDTVLGWVRAGRRTSQKAANEATELWRVLSRYKDEPVLAAVGALRDEFDREARELLNEILVPVVDGAITVSVLDVPELTAAFEQEVRESGLLVLHSQFWVPSEAPA